jgi:DNA-directed RNA polymerase I, II, and III subunit RPABC2
MRDPVHVSQKMLGEKNQAVDDSKSENRGKERDTEESTSSTVGALRFDSISSGTIPLTKYEKSRIVGARALQISLGAPILVQFQAGVVDPLAIAEIELKMNVLPITIHRKLPGARFQNIPLSKLAKEWL